MYAPSIISDVNVKLEVIGWAEIWLGKIVINANILKVDCAIDKQKFSTQKHKLFYKKFACDLNFFEFLRFHESVESAKKFVKYLEFLWVLLVRIHNCHSSTSSQSCSTSKGCVFLLCFLVWVFWSFLEIDELPQFWYEFKTWQINNEYTQTRNRWQLATHTYRDAQSYTKYWDFRFLFPLS